MPGYPSQYMVALQAGLEGDSKGKTSFHKAARAQLVNGKPQGRDISLSRAGLMSIGQPAGCCTPSTRAPDLCAANWPAPRFPGAAELLPSELKSNHLFCKT